MSPTVHRPDRPARSPRLWIAASAAAALLAAGAGQAGALPPGGAVSKPNGAKLTLSVKQVKQGGVIRVVGTNWKAKGSRVSGKAEVTIKLDDRDIVAVFPIKNKRFAGNVRISKRVKPGRHWLRALAAEPATSVKSPVFRVVKATPKATRPAAARGVTVAR